MTPAVEGSAIADDGCALWTSLSGYGDPPLILIHGGPGLWDYLADLAALLTGVARTVRWDQRGCGRSTPTGPYSVDRGIADLDAVRASLGVDRVDLLGHSWGAFLGLRYALRHPERVRRLVYVSGVGVDPESTWVPTFHLNMGRYAPRWADLAPGSREQVVQQWAVEFVDESAGVAYAERMATPFFGINGECNSTINAEVRRYLRTTDVPALCRTLPTPTLIIDGDRDPRPRWAVDSLHAALPESTRLVLRDAGHLPWVEHPTQFRTAVEKFLRT